MAIRRVSPLILPYRLYFSVKPSILSLWLQFLCLTGRWHQEAGEFLKNQRKRPWINCNILDKGPPLLLLLFLSCKCWRERIGRLGRYHCPTSRKRGRDGAGEPVVIEGE